MKCQKGAKNAHLKVSEPMVTSSHASFVQTTAQNTQFSFIIMNDIEKQQILTFKRQNQQNFLLFI